jgi:molybdopterin converting factor small subunit
MKVNIRLPGFLSKFAGQQEMIQVTGNTVDECLTSLESRFPEMKEWLHDTEGNLQNHIWLVVNGQTIYPEDLTSPLNDGAEILILLAIGGG